MQVTAGAYVKGRMWVSRLSEQVEALHVRAIGAGLLPRVMSILVCQGAS